MRVTFIVAWVALCAACGRGPTLLSPTDASDVVDERVPIPPPNPNYFDIVTPEEIVQPGEEKMFCLYVDNTAGELAVDQMLGYQGIGGHHISLMTSVNSAPAGTVIDCTSPQANADLRWFILTTAALPNGTAMSVPAGMQLVLQSHYINEQDSPILIRDLARLHIVEPATVTTWAATMVATDVGFTIPPGPATAVSQCELDADRDLLAVFGHMHQWGTRFEVDSGPTTTSLAPLYTVDTWQPSFKDFPPIQAYYDDPIHLPATTVFRWTCDWANTTNTILQYPTEMCFTFAYLGGAKTPAHCVPFDMLAPP
jgi:hypothetical protein